MSPMRNRTTTVFTLAVVMALAARLPAQQAPAAAAEGPSHVPAQAFLGSAPLQGEGYTVYPQAYNDGLVNTYQFTGPSGTAADVLTTGMVLDRIAEAAAIVDLRRVSSAEKFGQAIGKAGGDTLKAAGGAIMNPLKTLGSIPKGASRMLGGIGESMKGGSSEYEDKAYTEMAGASKAKRQLAAKYNVNPYSTNPELQAELNKVAWVQASVAKGIDIGLGAATAGAGAIAVKALNVNRNLYQRMIDEDPPNLRIANRKQLLALGLSREQTEPLLKHPHFSPWHETVICDSLAALQGVDVSPFLACAVQAQAEEDARFFQAVAQMMKLYHQTEAPIRRVVQNRLVVWCEDGQGRVLVPVAVDYMVFSPLIASRLGEMAQSGKPFVLWTTGQISPRLQEELAKRKIAFKAGVDLSE